VYFDVAAFLPYLLPRLSRKNSHALPSRKAQIGVVWSTLSPSCATGAIEEILERLLIQIDEFRNLLLIQEGSVLDVANDASKSS
jgi:hypothetical protein